MIGKVVGNCKITEKIGVGGFGTVYKGIQISLNREVAVKVLHPQFTEADGFVERFQSEAKILAALSHNNIVQVYDIIQEDETYFIIMEYVKGRTMKETLVLQKKLPLEQAVKAARDVAGALSYTHRKNIIHRDIKPANIIFSDDGTAKVMDFGIAKVLTDANQSFTRVGSLSYSSPEQITGEPVDVRTDVYALGVTLYQMLTGELPSTAEGAPSLRAKDASIPPALEKVVIKALRKKKEDRYAAMDLFLKDLEAVNLKTAKDTGEDKTALFSGEETILVKDKGQESSAVELLFGFVRKFKKPVWLYLSAAVILAITLTGLFARRPPGPEQQPAKGMVGPSPDAVSTPTAVPKPAPVEQAVISPEERRLSEQFYNEGLKHTSGEEWIEAVKDFEKAVGHNSENPLAQYELGFAYSQLAGRAQEARMHMEKAIELDPQNIIYRYSLGLVYINAGDKAKALRIWEEARTIDPENDTINAVLKKYKD